MTTMFYLAETENEVQDDFETIGASRTLQEIERDLKAIGESEEIQKLGIFEITIKRLVP